MPLLNGAKIGSGCLIGANALVTANMVVPDGAVVLGSPGKIVRSLDQEGRQQLLVTAHHYVENGRRYRHGLQQVQS